LFATDTRQVDLKTNKQYFFNRDKLHVFLDILSIAPVWANSRTGSCLGKRYLRVLASKSQECAALAQ